MARGRLGGGADGERAHEPSAFGGEGEAGFERLLRTAGELYLHVLHAPAETPRDELGPPYSALTRYFAACAAAAELPAAATAVVPWLVAGTAHGSARRTALNAYLHACRRAEQPAAAWAAHEHSRPSTRRR